MGLRGAARTSIVHVEGLPGSLRRDRGVRLGAVDSLALNTQDATWTADGSGGSPHAQVLSRTRACSSLVGSVSSCWRPRRRVLANRAARSRSVDAPACEGERRLNITLASTLLWLRVVSAPHVAPRPGDTRRAADLVDAADKVRPSDAPFACRWRRDTKRPGA